MKLLAALVVVASLVGLPGCNAAPPARNANWYAGNHALFGHFDLGAAELRSNLAALEKENADLYDITQTEIYLADICRRTGEVAEAMRLADEAVQRAERLPGKDKDPVISDALVEAGMAYLASGDTARARELCERAVSLDASIKPLRGVRSAELCIGGVALSDGDLDSAELQIQSAYDSSVLLCGPYSFQTAKALTARAGLRQRIARFDQAEDDYRRALEALAARRAGPSPEEGDALEGLASLLDQTGRAAEAQQARERAAAVRSSAGSCGP
jgi:tetratricopeptide (TPR) repeat protein